MDKSIYYEKLKIKIKNFTAKIGVIGLGYVGLPLSIELSKSGYEVYGIDIDVAKVARLMEKYSYILDVKDEELKLVIENKKFKPTTDYSVIERLDAISICVPTPLTKTQEPDMSFIISAVEEIRKYMHKGLLIILESTTYPGTTEELIEAVLSKNGFEVGKDYFLCFSPERVDPGNKMYNIKTTPKVIGGMTKRCTEIGCELYSNIVEKLVPVSSPKVAEMSKLLENSFRSINIAFINEMAMLCDKLEIDIWETIDASSTKPFGFMKFTPGPGIGGHCIPLDPMYLAWKARGHNFYSRYIELAQEINKNMPNYVVSKVGAALNNICKSIKNSKILILGLAYKPNVNDLRESPSLEIYEHLIKNGAIVDVNDPYATSFLDQNNCIVNSIDMNKDNLGIYDCVLLLTDHSNYNYKEILEYAKLIVDTRDGFKKFENSKVVKIGDALPIFNEVYIPNSM